MPRFVGTHRTSAADFLVRRFDAMSAGEGPVVVTLQAPLGMGKTRIVQEFYAALARERQPAVPYWPAVVVDDDEHLLTARKRVAPKPFVAPGGAALPWLWWAIDCHVSHVGSPMQSLQTAAPQLEAHAAAIQSEVVGRAERREDVTLAVDALFDLLGVVNPGAAIDAAQKGWTLWRRRRDRRAKSKDLQTDRIVDPDERARELATELATSVRALSSIVPIVLVVDDAQWADPALVSLLRHAGELVGSRLLVVCCVWPEALVEAAGTDTFASWLATFERAHPDRLARIPLDPLSGDDLVAIVLEAAPHTTTETARSVVQLASGNPLTLNLILDLDRVRRDIEEDGRIDLDPASLAGLPRDVEALYQELWRQLPEADRRVLAALSLQGPRFTPDWLDRFATSIGQYAEITSAYRRICELDSWIRSGPGPFEDFAELARHRVAFDNVQQILSDDEQRSAYQAATSHLLQLRQGDAWMSASSEIRRDVLNQFLELNERLGDEAERDLAALVDAALELADLELDTLHAERAIELARTALRSVDPGDRLTDARARRVLANALVAAGRAPEAIPLLERAATESSDDADVADLREAVELAESGPVIASDVGELRLSEWEPWEPKPVASLTSLSASEIGGLIAEVVACEGPVLFGRVAFLLREASGASRAGAAIRNALDRGLAAAVASGTVVASAPDASGESRRRTLRAPGQVVTVRTLGPRDAWDVPPDEMEALARTIVAVERPPDREALKRRVASLYGWKRYTAPLDELLESNLPGDIAVSAARVSTPPSAGAPDTSGVAAEISTAGSAGEVRLEAWEPWQEHPVESLTSLDASHLGELIAEIVDAEGPVLVRRVTYLLRVASGASRAGGAMRDAIERGLAAAVEGGRLVVSDPDALGDADRRTLSVPGQPTRIRVLPPRDTWDVPAAELALLARTIVSDGAHVDREAVKRRIGDLYGWSRYTGPLDELLEALLPEDI